MKDKSIQRLFIVVVHSIILVLLSSNLVFAKNSKNDVDTFIKISRQQVKQIENSAITLKDLCKQKLPKKVPSKELNKIKQHNRWVCKKSDQLKS